MSRRNNTLNMHELKFFDQSITDASYDESDFLPKVYSEANNSPIAIPQGPKATERIGRDVEVKSIQVRGSARYQPTTANGFRPAMMRFILVQDMRPNGAVRPSLSQIFVTNTVPYNSFQNLFYKDRFTVLIDKKYEIKSCANEPTDSDSDPLFGIVPIHFTAKISKRRSQVQYSADSAVTSINVQYYYLLLATEPNVMINFSTRTRFYG